MCIHTCVHLHTHLRHLLSSSAHCMCHESYLVFQLPISSQTLFLPPLQNTSHATCLRKPNSTSKLQASLKTKCHIYCSIYVFLTIQYTPKCATFSLVFYLFKCIIDEVFRSCTPTSFFPQGFSLHDFAQQGDFFCSANITL